MGIVPSRKCTNCGLNRHVTCFVHGDSRCVDCRKAHRDESTEQFESDLRPSAQDHVCLTAGSVAAANPAAEPTLIEPGLISAFIETHYRVKLPNREITLRVGHSSPELTNILNAIGVSSSAFITAANPFSRELPEAVNAERNIKLASQALKLGAVVAPALGSAPDGSWVESSWLLMGIGLIEAKTLAAEFEQNAFVWLEAGQPASLILCR